jgi:GatB/GatE catalytic domain
VRSIHCSAMLSLISGLRPTASEVLRHIELLESGQSVPQETRGYDEIKAETYSLRSKADAPDYRYMPDPNIPPLVLDTVRSPFFSHVITNVFLSRRMSRGCEVPCQSCPMLLASGSNAWVYLIEILMF